MSVDIESKKNRIFNLSDHATIEDFVNDIADELCVARPKIRVPEWCARLIARHCGRLFHLPLTESRIDALTNRSIYSNQKITDELSYTHPVLMEDGLKLVVNECV